MNNVDRDIQRKLRALRHAEQIGDVSKTCRTRDADAGMRVSETILEIDARRSARTPEA